MERTEGQLLWVVAALMLLPIFSTSWAAEKAIPEKAKYGGTLVVGVDREPRSLDCRYLGGQWRERPGYNQIYDRLVDYGPSGVKELVPLLATSWERIDNVSWLIHLRKGVKYHNGKEMTSEDVKTQLGWFIKRPEGWKASTEAAYARPLEKVEVVDRYTIKMTLKYSNYALFEPFILLQAMRGLGDPEQILGKQDRPVREPVGTGPFKLAEWVAGDHLTIIRNEEYWGKRPYLDKVIFRILPDNQTRLLALQKGEIDVATVLGLESTPVVEKTPHLQLHKIIRVRMGGSIYFNMRRWPMNNVKFRRAIAMAADWEKIAKAAHPYGMGIIRRTYLEDSWAYNPKAKGWVLRFDPNKAKSLLTEVEAEAGKKIPLIYAMGMKEEVGANFIQIATAELKKNIGINLDLRLVPYSVFQEKRRRDPRVEWDVMLAGGIGPEIDPELCFQYYKSDMPRAGDGKNETGYSNPKVDQLLLQGVTTLDRNKRITIYQEVEKLLFDDLPSIPVYNTPILFGVRDRVHGFKDHNSCQIFLTSPWSNIWVDKK